MSPLIEQARRRQRRRRIALGGAVLVAVLTAVLVATLHRSSSTHPQTQSTAPAVLTLRPMTVRNAVLRGELRALTLQLQSHIATARAPTP